MRLRVQMMVALVSVALLAGRVLAANNPEDEALGNAALAERISQAAQISLATGALDPPSLRYAAIMFEAASKLNPTEPRFLRLATEAYTQLGGPEGREGALAALTRYRALDPADIGAQIQIITLYYTKLETAEARKKYLDQILGDSRFPDEVRAQVAVQAASLAEERTEGEQARQYVDQALKLMPLCPGALKMKYRQMTYDTPLPERVATGLQLLRSNPAQTNVMVSLAADLADAGLVDPSMYWYQQAFALSQRAGQPIGPATFNSYAAELIIADQLVTADTYVRALLEQDPGNADAAMMALLIAKRSGSADRVQSAAEKCRASYMMALSHMSDGLNGRTGSTTQPAGEVDYAADARKLATIQGTPESIDYAAALAGLAWTEIYFNGKPSDAQSYMAALRQLVPADSSILARLDGWSYLADGKTDEAKVKLSAVADRDPLATLGMMRLDTSTPADQATTEAKGLLMKHPSGLLGATLIEALRGKVGLLPPGPDAQACRDALDKFPKEWLDFLDFSRVKNFYTLKAETKHVSHPFGVPMLATVTLVNTGNYDLTIGPEGAIRPDLWFDVQVKGLVTQYLPGVAFDRLNKRTILHPRESMSIVTRVDQGDLLKLMMQNAYIAHPLYFSVFTNPVTQQNGIAPGPGGFRASFNKVVERSASPLTGPAMTTSFNQLLSGPADVKVRTIELLGYYASRMLSDNDQQWKAKGTEIADIIRKSTGDSLPAVRAQASVMTAMLSDPSTREGIVRSLLTGSTFAERVMGITAAAQLLKGDRRKELVTPVADGDPDPILKRLAASVCEMPDQGPTSQPSPDLLPAGSPTTLP